MGVKSFLIEKFLGPEIESRVSSRLQAAVADNLAEVGWRRLTGVPTRELPTVTQERAIEIAYWLWKTNPLAKWIIEITTAFVCAEGTPYTCKNEEVKKILDTFWFDPVNRMDLHWENFVRELGIYGEQCWPSFVAQQTGRVRCGYVDPALIDQVIPDPENVKVKIGVILKGRDGRPGKKYRIVLDGDVQDFLSTAGQALVETFDDGLCFYFQVNALTNEMRGTGDLFTVADHLDAYEQFLFDSAEKYAQYNAFFYDITVDGADNKELQEQRNLFQPPKTGEAFIHNEKVKADAVSPDLNAYESTNAARLHRNHILGAVGIPEHWYGGGGDVNRATASEMDAPSRKLLTSRQERTKNMLEMVLDFVIQSALDAGYLRVPEEEAFEYEIQTPEISAKDVAKLAQLLTSVTAALSTAQANSWIDEQTARQAFAYFIAGLGYEYNPDEQEETEPGYEDYKDKKRVKRTGEG